MEETVFSSFLWWAGLKGEEHITRSTIRRSARVQCRSGEISAPVACRAPLQWPHVALLCSRTESPTISRHEIADWNCKDSDGNHRMLILIKQHFMRWSLRMMECAVIYVEKQIRIHVEKQSQLEPRWKIVQRSLLAEVSAVYAWFISSPPMKAIKKPMMKHAMKVLFWKFELHI